VDEPPVPQLHLASRYGGDGRVVGHDEHGGMRSSQSGDQPDNLRAGGGVEIAGGLVGKHDIRCPGHGTCDRGTLPLPAGQLARPVPGTGRQAHPLHRRSGGGPALPPGQATVEQSGGDVVEHSQVFDQVKMLEHEADPPGTLLGQLTLLYTSLFVICGGLLVLVTYVLLADNLRNTTTSLKPTEALIQQCVSKLTANGADGGIAKQKCAAIYAKGVNAGAQSQRTAALDHLLLYSLLTLGGVTVLAAVAGWMMAGRILRPVRQLTAAARAASEQNLSQRLALKGPRDELHELADTFDDLLARLDRAFTSQRQFIANAGHELRTPLTVMRTAIDVVLAKPNPTPAELVSMSTEVRHSVDHAERLIDALLTLDRNERASLVFDSLDLAAITEDALDAREPDGLTTLATLDEAPVAGDGVLLERPVANLLDNATRYNMPSGTVAISTASEDGQAVLRVVNTGTVVAPGEIERLFQPFTRLDDRTRHDGFGLGLALVSSIAAVHGGTVSAVAIPSGGLDVTVRLPSVVMH
jgi:signal transduction histidine kinase